MQPGNNTLPIGKSILSSGLMLQYNPTEMSAPECNMLLSIRIAFVLGFKIMYNLATLKFKRSYVKYSSNNNKDITKCLLF